MDSSSPSPSKWPGLPADVLKKITKRLDTRTDILHVRAVCCPWRSSVPLPPRNLSPAGSPPLQLPFPIGPNKYLHPRRRGHFLLKETTFYCLEPLTKIASAWNCSTKYWFVKIEDSNDSGRVRLKDPLSRFTIKKLGKIANLPSRVINLLDYRVREVGKTHCLEFVESSKIDDSEGDFNELKSIMIKKVIVGSKNESEFCVMAIHTGGKLGLWKMGDEKWAKVVYGRGDSRYQDIAFHNGMFYAVDYTGLTIAVDPSSLEVSQVTPPMVNNGGQFGGFFKYLVNSLGDLFLIDHYIDVDFDFHIEDDSDDEGGGRRFPYLELYKFDEARQDWISVKGLGDQVMFVGDGCCFSVSAKDFVGLKKNCVYFPDDSFSGVNDGFPGWDAGLFDLEDNVSQPLKSVVGYSTIFWPPPTWLGQKPNWK